MITLNTEESIDANEKYQTYVRLMQQLNIAREHGFRFEMCMISYAVIEDRSSAALRHAGECDQSNLYMKIGSLKKVYESDNKLFHEAYDIDLFDAIDRWRRERNQLVHSLATIAYDDTRIEKVAEDGFRLARRLRDMVTRYKSLMS